MRAGAVWFDDDRLVVDMRVFECVACNEVGNHYRCRITVDDADHGIPLAEPIG